MKLYCLKSPSGELCHNTIGIGNDFVWSASFDIVSREEGPEWTAKYWKKWGPSLRNAKRRGWKIVPVRVTEIKG